MSDYILINGTLYHHGIKGQKWGNRRWQNEDGSLTSAGRERYGYGTSIISRAQNRADRAKNEAKTAHKLAKIYTNAMDRKAAKRQSQADSKTNPISRYRAQNRADRAKEEAKTAHKIANAYSGAMDRKAEKRQAKADFYKTKEGQEKLKKYKGIGKAILTGAVLGVAAVKIYQAGKVSQAYKDAVAVGRNLSKGFSAEQLKDMGIEIFEYDKFTYDKF